LPQGKTDNEFSSCLPNHSQFHPSRDSNGAGKTFHATGIVPLQTEPSVLPVGKIKNTIPTFFLELSFLSHKGLPAFYPPQVGWWIYPLMDDGDPSLRAP